MLMQVSLVEYEALREVWREEEEIPWLEGKDTIEGVESIYFLLHDSWN